MPFCWLFYCKDLDLNTNPYNQVDTILYHIRYGPCHVSQGTSSHWSRGKVEERSYNPNLDSLGLLYFSFTLFYLYWLRCVLRLGFLVCNTVQIKLSYMVPFLSPEILYFHMFLYFVLLCFLHFVL